MYSTLIVIAIAFVIANDISKSYRAMIMIMITTITTETTKATTQQWQCQQLNDNEIEFEPHTGPKASYLLAAMCLDHMSCVLLDPHDECIWPQSSKFKVQFQYAIAILRLDLKMFLKCGITVLVFRLRVLNSI